MSASNGLAEPKSSLPTFTSIHDQPARQFSYAGSSNASSSRSATRSHTRSNYGDESRQSPSLGVREDPIPRDASQGYTGGTVKRQKRSSGGFLLDSSPASSRLSRSILARKSIKGKEKPQDNSLLVPKSRRPQDTQGSSSSFRGSMISSGIRTDSPDQIQGNGSHHSSQKGLDNDNQESTRDSQTGSARSQGVPSFGFDTDPAQIVDMALRLNEGRRRQVSGKRFVSSGTAGRRVVSNAPSLPAKPSPPNKTFQNGSIEPVSRVKTRNPEPLTPERPERDLAIHKVDTSPRGPDGFSPEQDGEEIDNDMQISRATQNRVAKAKAYFELAYEHRRLLSHLPPIRPPDIQFASDKPGYDSKAYNPLQYARNRKLRFRERHPINSEVEGWYDVEKVRNWVDAVVSSHPDTHHDPRQCIRLPPLTLLEDTQEPDDDEDVNKRTRPGKPRRPKSDWITHPGDLIADAFWTEQGLNKQKIHNRDNEPIYPPGTKFQFSGWRNRAPLEVPEELKSSSPEMSPTMNKKAVDSPPDLPTFESAHKDHSWARTKSKFGKRLKKSKREKKQTHDIFDTSSESSDSDTSMDNEKDGRGRKRLVKDRTKLELSDGDPFAKPIQAAQRADSVQSNDAEVANRDSHRESIDRASLLRYLQRTNTSTTGFTDDTDKAKPSRRRKLLDTIKLDADYAGRSSFEYDSTAPGTPAAHGFPSIAINLSPPNSRSPSPSLRGTTFLGAFKDRALSTVNSRDQRDHIERNDFAKVHSHTSSKSRNSFSRSKNMSRSTSPTSRGISPANMQHKRSSVDEPVPLPAEHRGSNISKVSSRTNDSHRHHRVRGMFKGGRIAELVGNEVSRVGDYIWKREPPKTSVLDGGSISGYETDSDDFSDYGGLQKKKVPKRASRLSLTNSQSSARSTSPTSKIPKVAAPPAQQYHIQGLPSFTSPFQRDRDTQDKKGEPQSPGGTPIKAAEGEDDADPISAGNAAQKAGRSSRFDRLAPPKLDIRAATPDGRRSSYGFGQALDLSRTLSASQMYNSAISGAPSKPRESTRLSSMAFPTPYFHSNNSSQNDLSLARTRSSGNTKHVTVHDWARVRGLLASVAVKATNMVAYCDEIPRPQSAFLYSAFETTKASGSEIDKQLPAARKNEHALAARHLIGHLNQQSGQFNDRLTHFTSSVTVGLQREMQILEDKTESSLFPRLQRLSDEAGQLAQKLTTTSTLAVRTVNDEVTEAARLKRRGPYRLSRALWFKLIEWGVVGLLWAIWFVVTIIRISVGTVRGIWAVISWLFWLR